MATAPVDIPVKVRGLSDLQKLERKIEALEQDIAKLTRGLPQAANGIRQTGRAAATATGNIQRMGVAFRTTLAPIVAVYGAINFLNKSLEVASQRQVNVAKLSNGLRNLGGTAADLENLVDAADKFGRSTLFDQEDATQAFALLTSFQRIGVDSYERVTKAAADLATVTGQDLKGAMTQLSKALEDPARRVTDLARSGTVFTEQQKEQIKTLQESGRLFEAQNLILKEIEKQYGGAAEAAGSAGLAGAMDTLGEATRDFQEQLVSGTGAINLAESAIYGLADAIDTATASLRDIQTLISALDLLIRNLNIGMDGLAGVFDIVNDAIIRSIPGLREAIFAYEQLLKLAGKYVDSQAGPRNFGSNYASQEKALFAAAGGWTPYGNKRTPTPTPTPRSGGVDKAAKEQEQQRKALEKQFQTGEKIKQNLERQLQLLSAGSDLERDRLKIAHELEDTIARITKTAAPAQQAGLIVSAREVAAMKDVQAIVENSNWDEMSQWFEEQSAMTQELGQEYQALADTIAGVFGNAFRSIIDGSKSAKEAFADMLGAMANALIDYAVQAIAQYIAIGIARAFAGIGGGDTYKIPDAAVPKTSGMKFFADGGYVTGPTNAVIGEGGESEYVIPASRMESAMERYSAGHRGDSVLDSSGGESSSNGVSPISLNVVSTEIGGEGFVKVADLELALAQTRAESIAGGAKAGEARALRRLRQSPSARRSIGL